MKRSATLLLLSFLAFATTAFEGSYGYDEATRPFPPFPRSSLTLEDADESRNFVSATLGSNMVLQRGRPAVVWGFAEDLYSAPISTELRSEDGSLVFNGTTRSSPEDGGLWRQVIPPQPESLKPFSLSIRSLTTGQSTIMTNVLFGDVYVCGGQSNMQFSIPGTTNSTEEAERADHYPHIRLFTVGQGTSSEGTPLQDLQTVEQHWTVASQEIGRAHV